MGQESSVKTLGILGGGQLGRMSVQAATVLGIDTVIFTPGTDDPATQLSNSAVIADYSDHDALTRFADQVDVISYEFENIPVETVQFLKKLKPVYPDDNLLKIAQDRLREKTFLNEHGIPTAKFSPAKSPEEIFDVLKAWNQQKCIIKTTRFGYDGKGQYFIDISDKTDEESQIEITNGWNSLNTDIVIIEELIDFDFEVSVIVARDQNGHMETYGPCLNEHTNHILSRTHNSGHWSIDACAVSQFENHVRTVCGMEAAPAGRHHDCEMINLIGDDVLGIDEKYKNTDNAHVHLYGKNEVKPGRKMGHVTILKNSIK